MNDCAFVTDAMIRGGFIPVEFAPGHFVSAHAVSDAIKRIQEVKYPEADPETGYYRIKSPRFRIRDEGGIPSSIFYYDGGGFNNVAEMDCPTSRNPHKTNSGRTLWPANHRMGWVYSGFCINYDTVNKFLSHCEYLGTAFPLAELMRCQNIIKRLAADNKKPVAGTNHQKQMTLF